MDTQLMRKLLLILAFLIGSSAWAQNQNFPAAPTVQVNGTQFVSTGNPQNWGGSDFGAWVNSAIAALPLYNGKPAGTIYLGPGQFTFTTTIQINSPYVYLVGSPTTLTYSGSTIAIQFNDAPTSYDGLGGLKHVWLYGNATANVVGIDMKEVTWQKWEDVSVNNFTGTGAAGIRFENVSLWTENNDFDNVRGSNNTVGMLFTDNCAGNTGCGSFAYTRFHHVNMSLSSASQVGFLAIYDANFNGTDLDIACFMYAGATCLHLENTSTMIYNRLKITGEGTGSYNGIVTDLHTIFTPIYQEFWNSGTATDTFSGTYTNYVNINLNNGILATNANGIEFGTNGNAYVGTLSAPNLTFYQTWQMPNVTGTTLVENTQGAGAGLVQISSGNVGCTTGSTAGNSCASAVTVTWHGQFQDTNYWVGCFPGGPASSGIPSAPYVASIVDSQHVSVNYYATTNVAAAWSYVNCIAVHP